MVPPSVLHLTKFCTSPTCPEKGKHQPLTNFYIRSGIEHPTEPGHYLSECKVCMRARNQNSLRLPADEPRAFTEKIAIQYLHEHGVHALPGKAVSAADVDVVAWGAVWIEVKYARLDHRGHQQIFAFTNTPKQQQRGYLAHLLMLICEYPVQTTFHLFDAKAPVFYMMNGRIKHGFTVRPGATKALKHGDTRVVMLQSMMDEAQDRLSLIPQTMQKISADLRLTSAVRQQVAA